MKCTKSKSEKLTGSLASTSANGTTGHANAANDDTNRQHKLYTVAIFGDEGERTLALTKIMLMHCVTAVINFGDTETREKIISTLKSNNLAKEGINFYRFVPTNTENKMTN